MTVYASKNASRTIPAVQPHGSEAVTVRFEFDLSAVLLNADVVKMGWLPANCKVVDWTLDCDDIDTGGAGVFDFGILTNAAVPAIDITASGGAAWVAASELGQDGGLVRALTKTHTRMVVSRTADQLIGLVVGADFTDTATGKIGATLTYIAA